MTAAWAPVVADAELERLIAAYGNDFTADARAGRFDPITGRDAELDDLVLILLQRGRKNAVLLGPAGVGKTALVTGLAQRVAAGEVPDLLAGARLIEIDMARMAAGTDGPAAFQGRFIPLCKGVAERARAPGAVRTILFVDEMHQIMPSCRGSAYAGLSDVMKPYLTAGDLMVIGATTLDEYREYVARDPALDRRFQRITLRVPSAAETRAILDALAPRYEAHHGVEVPRALRALIVELTEAHLRRRNQPDKSIVTMDAAMARHVQARGRGGVLEAESVYHMVAREAGITPAALDDPARLTRLEAAYGGGHGQA